MTMPLILNQLPLSGLMGFFWFFLLFLAGVTSSISLAQPAVAFLEDEFDIRIDVDVAGVAVDYLDEECLCV